MCRIKNDNVMAKTVPISKETYEQLEELKEMFKSEMLLPIKVNQFEAVAIAVNECFKKRKKE